MPFDRTALVNHLVEADRTRVAGTALPKEFLRTIVDFAARYAKLERLLFEGTQVLYSDSALGLDLSLQGNVVEQGEQLAKSERDRFSLPPGPILDLGYLIEDQGIKVIPRRFPAGTHARGGFFFDAVLGPCILLNIEASPAERDYILAHQYGHFLADFDPYIKAICGHPDPRMLSEPSEVRAHQFALAYLMPKSDLEMYHEGMGLSKGSVPSEFVRQLGIYFDLDLEIVFWRLLSLGWIEPQNLASLLASEKELAEELRRAPEGPGLDTLLPEKFVHLVASAFGKHLIDLEDAAEYLDTDVASAERILGQFRFEDRPERQPRRGAARLAPAAKLLTPARKTPKPNPN